MRHGDDEIEQAARRFDELTEQLDPASAQVERTEDLRQVAAASQAVRAGEGQLREAVHAARGQGRSWNEIALAMGVSRQAARQRFSNKTSA